jgi:CO/xanthine dehydrogenase Mo-binding subunit
MRPFTVVPPQVDAAQRRRQASRRDFLVQSGMLVVSFGVLPEALVRGAGTALAQGAGPYPDLDFRQLDSWIVIRQDNTATLFVGKTDLGQGTGTAFRQLLADELDLAFAQTSVVMGSTDLTVDQGGSGGSDALQVDGWPMRRVAAEARRVLLEMAAPRLGVPVAELAPSESPTAI